MLQAFAFYLFAGILLTSAIMVISSRNPVHSVLFLILSFFNAAGLFIMLGAEFVGFILVIVYVGAVAVLFLFVVMMLDINFKNLRKGAMTYVPIGLIVGGILLAELALLYGAWKFVPNFEDNLLAPIPVDEAVDNTRAMGRLLYTDFVYAFQMAGLVLFVAMVGAIVLTLRKRPGVRRQKVGDQFARTPEESMEIRKIGSRTGV